MAWTKTKTVIATSVILLLAAAGTTTVSIEKVRENRLEKIWRINKPVPTAVIDRLPPMVKMLPTKFDPPWVDWNCGTNGDKFAGARVRAGDIAVYAYGVSHGRIRFAEAEPTNRFDFVATLPHGSAQALQRELKVKLGLVGHREMEDMDVLALRVARLNAPGLKPAIPGKEDQYSNNGVYHSSNEAITDRYGGFSRYLEFYFKKPVIDQTGLTQHFSMDLRWKETVNKPNPDGLKQAMLDRFGLELVPTNMPVEMLVMEKTR